MTSRGSILFEHPFAIARVSLIQISLVVDQLPSSMFRYFLMRSKALPQVAGEAVVECGTFRILQHVDVEHVSIESESAGL